MPDFPVTPWAPVLRTDFGDDEVWVRVCDEILLVSDEGFEANVTFVDDPAFDGLDIPSIIQSVPADYFLRDQFHTFVVLVDKAARMDAEHPVLVVDLSTSPDGTSGLSRQ